MGSLIHRSNDIQYLELFLATTLFDQNGNISTVSLSMTSELMLEEPLFIASVITFGIEGDCILEEMVVNSSIDEIIFYGNNNNTCTVLHTYVRTYLRFQIYQICVSSRKQYTYVACCILSHCCSVNLHSIFL